MSVNVMVTTGGTSLRDDIMRLDETGLYQSVKWCVCLVDVFASLPHSACTSGYSRPTVGPGGEGSG